MKKKILQIEIFYLYLFVLIQIQEVIFHQSSHFMLSIAYSNIINVYLHRLALLLMGCGRMHVLLLSFAFDLLKDKTLTFLSLVFSFLFHSKVALHNKIISFG